MPNAMPKTKANNEPYRKVKITMWDDPKFRSLSPLPPSGQSLFIYLLTGPFTGIIPGLFKAGRAALAEELGWEVEAFDLALGEAITLGLVKADLQARVFWLPNAAKHNPPGSINVVKSWAKSFDYLPECSLKWEAWKSLQAACYGVSEAIGLAYDKAMPLPKDMPTPLPSGIQRAVNSKQILKPKDLLPDAEKKQRQAADIPEAEIFIRLPLADGSGHPVTLDYIAEQKALYPGVNINQELRNMFGWLDSNPTRRKTSKGVKRFITTWLQRCQDNPKNSQVAYARNQSGSGSLAERSLQQGREQWLREQSDRYASMAPVGEHGADLREPLDCEEWQSSHPPVGAANRYDDC